LHFIFSFPVISKHEIQGKIFSQSMVLIQCPGAALVNCRSHYIQWERTFRNSRWWLAKCDDMCKLPEASSLFYQGWCNFVWSLVSKHLWVLIFDVQFETGNYVQEANVCNQWRPGILWFIMSFLDQPTQPCMLIRWIRVYYLGLLFGWHFPPYQIMASFKALIKGYEIVQVNVSLVVYVTILFTLFSAAACAQFVDYFDLYIFCFGWLM
jgi:hypothetical protein